MPDGEIESQTIDCGTLTVPEDHNNPDGAQIQLAVARIHSKSASPAPDPILYLSGGPGDSALGEIADWVTYPFRDERDIILFDQRGTGNSTPLLKCDSSSDDNAVQACHDKLAKSANLSDFTTVQSAADIADLREALGYDQWNLLGISYGTRLALVTMRDQPDGIRSVILDSVYPPQIRDWEEEGTDETNAFNRIFEGCAADAACNQAYPDLKATFYQTVATLNENPASYTSSDSGDVTLSGDDLAEQIFQALYSTDNIPYIPEVMMAVSRGDYQPLDDLNSGAILNKSLKQDNADSGSADGQFNSITCSEEIPFDNYDRAIADAQAAPAELRDGLVASVKSMWDTCRIWNVTAEPASETAAVTSDLPTLVMEGEYDPVTPVAWGKSAADALPNSFFFEFPGLGHGTIDGGDCPMGIIRAFLADPTTQPDSSCIASMREPQFVVNP